MKKLLYIFILIAGTLQAAPHLTRNYTYRYFTTRDGLIQMQVLCAFQDRDGYMWFGTKGGISRWDGISFKNLTQEDDIPVGDVYNVGEWGYKKLFFIGNKFQILHENDSLELINIPDNLIFQRTNLLHIQISDEEIILLNLHNHLDVQALKCLHFIWNKSTRKFKLWSATDERILAYNSVYLLTGSAIYRREGLKLRKIGDLKGKYYFAQVNWESGEIYLRKEVNSCIDRYVFKNEKLVFSHTVVKDAHHEFFSHLKDGTILYFSQKYKLKFLPDRESNFGVEVAYPEKTYIDREGNLWIITNNGLFKYFKLNFEEYNFGLANPDNIWSVNQDNEQNMWFGSYGWGLWRLDKKGTLKAMNQNDPDWARQYMGSTRSRDGTLYLPSSGGLTVYRNKQFANLRTGISLSAYYDETEKQVYYSGLDIKTGIRGLWIGVDENRKFIPWKKGFPVGIGKDSKGRIRVGSFRGQGYLQADSIITDTIKREYEGVISYTTDKWGRLWKATTRGCYVELPDGKEFRFAPQIKGMLASIWNYHDKYLLIGTGSGMAIALMKEEIIDNPQVYEIGYENGFTGLETGQNAFFEDHNADMWVCTAVNVLKFNPEKLIQSRLNHIPSIRVSKIAFSADNFKWHELIFGDDEVKIDAENKFFSIEYIANSISSPKTLRFRYRLKGFYDNWSESIGEKSVSYTNLPYCKFTFEVMCSLDGENWSQVASSPEIEIVPPIYLQKIFIFAYVILIL